MSKQKDRPTGLKHTDYPHSWCWRFLPSLRTFASYRCGFDANKPLEMEVEQDPSGLWKTLVSHDPKVLNQTRDRWGWLGDPRGEPRLAHMRFARRVVRRDVAHNSGDLCLENDAEIRSARFKLMTYVCAPCMRAFENQRGDSNV